MNDVKTKVNRRKKITSPNPTGRSKSGKKSSLIVNDQGYRLVNT